MLSSVTPHRSLIVRCERIYKPGRELVKSLFAVQKCKSSKTDWTVSIQVIQRMALLPSNLNSWSFPCWVLCDGPFFFVCFFEETIFHSESMQVKWTGLSKLPFGVKVSRCVSICVASVIGWWPVQDVVAHSSQRIPRKAGCLIPSDNPVHLQCIIAAAGS